MFAIANVFTDFFLTQFLFVFCMLFFFLNVLDFIHIVLSFFIVVPVFGIELKCAFLNKVSYKKIEQNEQLIYFLPL
jgi:hypothetical protein